MKYLEYIELDGRSFIGTKLSPDDPGLTLEFWVKPGRSPWGDGQVGNGQYAVFAGSENGKGDRWAIQTADLTEEFVGENCGTYTNGITYYSTEWYHIVVENGELSVYQVDEFDGSETLVGQEQFDPSSVSLPNVFIGTLNKEDTDFYDAPCCGVFFGKIIVNGDELLPAEDDEGTQTGEPGTIGWFDEYNGIFYTNGGDGDFIPGPYAYEGLEFTPSSLSVGSGSTTQSVQVYNPGGHYWSVMSAPNWLSTTALTYDLTISISENVSGNTARSGNIEIYDHDDTSSYSFSVSQSAGAPIPVPVVESVYVNANQRQMSFPVTGGTTSGIVQVFVDLAPLDMYWRIHQYEPSDATLTINGVTGLTEYSGTTTGTTNFEIVIPPYTGTGVNWTKYIIECYSGGTKLDYMVGNTPFTIGRRQVTESKSIFLGDDLVDAMYIGDASASKAYIGDQLVWEAGPLETPAALGDVVVYSTNDSALKYIPNSDYNTNDYPTNTFKPVGVVCENQVDNSVCMISLDRLGGNSNFRNWGSWGTAESVLDVAQVSYYTGDISVAKTMNVGREVTSVLVSGNTEPVDFENNMGSVNYGNFPPDGQHTVAITAYMHYTSGTSRGEWFVPSPYDLRDMDANGWNIVSTSLGRLSGGRTLSQFWTCIMTQTGYNPNIWYLNGGNYSSSQPWYTSGGAIRAVYRGNITHI